MMHPRTAPVGEDHPHGFCRSFFEKPTVKHLGVVGFALMLGMAIGNGWATHNALQGQAAWLHEWCGKQVKTRIIQHQERDLALYGVTAPR